MHRQDATTLAPQPHGAVKIASRFSYHAHPYLPNLHALHSHEAALKRWSPFAAVQFDRTVQFKIPPQTFGFPTSPCMCSPTAVQSRSLSSGGSWHCFGTPTPGQYSGAVVSTMLQVSSLGVTFLGSSGIWKQ